MEVKAKNNKGLEEARGKVEEATQLERQIDKLDDAIKFLDSDIGFLDIRVNYNNQNEIRFAELFGAKTTHEVYSEHVRDHVIEHRNRLVEQFNKMKF